MAKWIGNIGFFENVEIRPGVWKEVITPYRYLGELIVNRKDIINNSQINDEIRVSNQIKIISNPYANNNFHNIKWVEFLGQKWKVTSVSVEQPNLLLTLGGIFNESVEIESSDTVGNNN